MTGRDDEDVTAEGQVSSAENLDDADEPIAPTDATAGYPDSETGHPAEGPAGPDAPSS